MKVGDTVVFKGCSTMAAQKGATAIITQLDEKFIRIEWVRDKLDCGQSNGEYFRDKFELLKKPIDYMAITKEIVGRR